jgi:hypothetical protein
MKAYYEDSKKRIGVAPDPNERVLSDVEKRAETAYNFYLHYKDALSADRDSEQGKQVWASMLTKFLNLVAARSYTPGALGKIAEFFFCRTLNKRYCRRSRKSYQELGNDRMPNAKNLLDILRLEGFFGPKDYEEWSGYVTLLHDEKRIPTNVFEAFYFEFESYGVDLAFSRACGFVADLTESHGGKRGEGDEKTNINWLRMQIERRRPYLVREDIAAFRKLVEECILHYVTRETLEAELAAKGYDALARSADDTYGIAMQSFINRTPMRVHDNKKGKILPFNPPPKEDSNED